MLVDRIGGHLGDVLRRLGLNVEGDKRVRDEVVDRLEPLLPHEVLPIVEQPVVEGLVTKPAAMEGRGRRTQNTQRSAQRVRRACFCTAC